MIIVFAVTDPAAGKKGMSGSVPRDTPGYEVIRGGRRKVGLHASDTCQIALTDVRIHESLRLRCRRRRFKNRLG